MRFLHKAETCLHIPQSHSVCSSGSHDHAGNSSVVWHSWDYKRVQCRVYWTSTLKSYIIQRSIYSLIWHASRVNSSSGLPCSVTSGDMQGGSIPPCTDSSVCWQRPLFGLPLSGFLIGWWTSSWARNSPLDKATPLTVVKTVRGCSVGKHVFCHLGSPEKDPANGTVGVSSTCRPSWVLR